MTTKIKPLLHRILVKPDQLEDVDPTFAAARRAGLALPEHPGMDLEKNRVDTGVVLALGGSAFRAYMAEADLTEVPVKVGDKISFAKYAGKIFNEDGVKYIVLNDEDVIAVMGE